MSLYDIYERDGACGSAGRHGGSEDAVTGKDPAARGHRPQGKEVGREKREGLDNYSLRFTVGKQLSLPIRLSFMVSFGLFLVA